MPERRAISEASAVHRTIGDGPRLTAPQIVTVSAGKSPCASPIPERPEWNPMRQRADNPSISEPFLPVWAATKRGGAHAAVTRRITLRRNDPFHVFRDSLQPAVV